MREIEISEEPIELYKILKFEVSRSKENENEGGGCLVCDDSSGQGVQVRRVTPTTSPLTRKKSGEHGA